jgi:hypothetical protein
MSFILTNTNASAAIVVGAFGASLPFNNDWTGLSLEQNAAQCSLLDPYIGLDAGFARVTRITGRGPLLLVIPNVFRPCTVSGAAAAACLGRLEAWRKMTEDPTPRSVSFEGFYEWQVRWACPDLCLPAIIHPCSHRLHRC